LKNKFIPFDTYHFLFGICNIPRSLSSNARDGVGEWDRDLPLLELHDEVSGHVLLADGMVAQLGSSGELEDLWD
jgi:hypothetical protein